MKINWTSLLFSSWKVLNSVDLLKLPLALFSPGLSVYAVKKMLNLPALSKRVVGRRHTPSILAEGPRMELRIIVACLVVSNLAGLFLYIWVWILVPKDAGEFPKQVHAAGLWASCLAAAFLTFVFLVIFERRYKNVNSKN